jgi:hypothetical protein
MAGIVELLARELISEFSSWIGTSYEELLDDGVTVIDHLKDDSEALRGIDLSGLSAKVWDQAWDIFDQEAKL